jgi:hypothetical protein
VRRHLKALVVSARVQLVPPITRADNLLPLLPLNCFFTAFPVFA